jgi:hypothetical protein
LRADMYRQKAADAAERRAGKQSITKSAFEEVAKGWLLFAEQMEWIERQRFRLRGEGAREQPAFFGVRRCAAAERSLSCAHARTGTRPRALLRWLPLLKE